MASKTQHVTKPPSGAAHFGGENCDVWVWWDDSANAVRVINKGIMDISTAEKMWRWNVALMEGRPEKKVDWIIDVHQMGKANAKIRNVLKQGYSHSKVGITAFIGAPLLMKASIDLATLFKGRDPERPYEFFDNEEDAEKWLAEMKKKRDIGAKK